MVGITNKIMLAEIRRQQQLSQNIVDGQTAISTGVTLNKPSDDALAYFKAIPRSWTIAPDDTYPDPVVDAAEGRKRALDAYENRDF